MRVLLQRVSEASVAVAGEAVSAIGGGLLILLGVEDGDGEGQADALARKVAALRVFADAGGKMNLSINQAGGSALVVSQFTLCADLSRGNRPGFSRAARPETAEALYHHFCGRLREHGVPVETGRFGTEMDVRLVNAGPVTIWIDTEAS
jgi:D-tyrosyl-tRNA(Tyr) deacylase